MKTHRNKSGQYAKAPKAIIVTVSVLLAVCVSLYLFKGMDVARDSVEAMSTTTEQVAEMDPRLKAMLEDENNKKLYELEMTKKLISEDRKDAQRQYEENRKSIDEEYKSRLTDEEKSLAERNLRLKMRLDDVLRQELEISSTTKSGLKG